MYELYLSVGYEALGKALGILKHLTQRRLPNVEIGRLLQMPGGYFRIGVQLSEAHELMAS